MPNKKGCKNLYIYAKAVILNETQYDLTYTYSKDQKKGTPIAGMAPFDNEDNHKPHILMVDEPQELIIERKEKEQESVGVNVMALGSTFAELFNKDHS